MKISTYSAMLLVLVTAQNAGAIQVIGEQSQAVESSAQTVSNEREGTIGRIDLDGKVIVVDGMNYVFSISTISVDGTSLLALRKNDRIRFKVVNESGKERITKIWLISPPRH